MTKGERLIWALFEMVREALPPTQGNLERFQQWSTMFHELEHTPPTVPPADEAAEEETAEPDAPPRRKKR